MPDISCFVFLFHKFFPGTSYFLFTPRLLTEGVEFGMVSVRTVRFGDLGDSCLSLGLPAVSFSLITDKQNLQNFLLALCSVIGTADEWPLHQK